MNSESLSLRRVRPNKHMPPQPVLPNVLTPLQMIPADFGQDMAPDDPVQEPEPEHRPARNGVRPVGEVNVRLAARRRAYEGHHEEEDVGCAEKCGGPDRER